ncbi:MAG: preprotein translocase subunit SecG [Bacteroidetes bacterium]|nr:preprotein translocase subunit SecG [Bacteroidota bacterium]
MTQFTIFLVLIVFVAFLLVVVVMVQNPKGGGLSSTFGGGGGGAQLGGVKKTTDFLDKSTWTLAIVLLVLILASNISLFDGTGSQNFLQDEIENVDLPEATDTPVNTGDSTGGENGL